MTDVSILHLPYPPSSNRISRAGVNPKTGRIRFYSSSEKTNFYKEADALCQRLHNQCPIVPINGPFTYHLVLNRKLRRSNSDGDNRGKYVLDYAQRIGFIENDKLAEGGSWQWGHCEHGAMLSVFPFPRGILMSTGSLFPSWLTQRRIAKIERQADKLRKRFAPVLFTVR